MICGFTSRLNANSGTNKFSRGLVELSRVVRMSGFSGDYIGSMFAGVWTKTLMKM